MLERLPEGPKKEKLERHNEEIRQKADELAKKIVLKIKKQLEQQRPGKEGASRIRAEMKNELGLSTDKDLDKLWRSLERLENPKPRLASALPKQIRPSRSAIRRSPLLCGGAVGDDLAFGIRCLERLGRSDEIDGFRERVIAVHRQNWRLLQAAARSYADVTHYGFIVAGEFKRGSHRGGGRWVNTSERDRVRALQLLMEALVLVGKEPNRQLFGQFCTQFADLLMSGREGDRAWRLQYLTDLTRLPDYDEGHYAYAGGSRGAPVEPDVETLHRPGAVCCATQQTAQLVQ